MDVERRHNWTIIAVKGEVDVYTAPRLKDEIAKQVREGRHRLLIDLEDVEFMDSTGLAVLVGGLKRVKEHEGTLELRCTRDSILRVLSLTGLNKVFPIHSSLEAALD